MTRFQFSLNITIVVLLVGLGVGLFVMPRYNYSHLMTRVAQAEVEVAALQITVEKLNILAGPTEEKRAAVLGNLDGISGRLKKLDEDLVVLLEHSFANSQRTEQLGRQVEAIEKTIQPMPLRDGDPANALVRSAFREPAGEIRGQELASQEKSRRDPRALAQLEFDDFLKTASEERLVRFSDVNQPSETLREKLRIFFKCFQVCVDSINKSEQLFTQELVEKATRTGDFSDEEHPGGNVKEVTALPGGGTVFVKSLDGGKRRVFQFPAEAFPTFRNFDDLRDRAQVSFLASLRALPQE